MEDNSQPYRDVILRYCPHLHKNVIMTVRSDENDKIFECQNQSDCNDTYMKACKLCGNNKRGEIG